MKGVPKILAEFGLAAISFYACIKLYARFYLNRFHLVGRVSQLLVYPVVSCGALPVAFAECTSNGLSVFKLTDKGMVVCKDVNYPDPKASYGECKMFFQSQLNEMKVTCNSKRLTLSTPTGLNFHHPTNCKENGKKPKSYQIACGTNIYRGYLVGDKISQWFQKYLNESKVRLIRRVRRLWDGQEGRIAMGNIIVMNEDSVVETCSNVIIDDTSKFEKTISIIRPNIIISGCGPYEENQWDFIGIGRDVVCHVTGSDIRMVDDNHESLNESGEEMRDSGECVELSTKYLPCCGLMRSFQMGLNVQVDREGEICVGDPVYAVYKRPDNLRQYLSKMYKVLHPL